MSMKDNVTGHNWFKKAITIMAVIGAVIIAAALIIAIIGLTITKEIIYGEIRDVLD